jgi:hypothetical protein
MVGSVNFTKEFMDLFLQLILDTQNLVIGLLTLAQEEGE